MPDGVKRWRLANRFWGRSKDIPDRRLSRGRFERRSGCSRRGGADLGPRPRPFLDQESCKGSASHEGADTFATVVGELADKRCRDKKAAATLRKFEWFMSFALVAIGSWPSTTLLLVCGLDRPQGGRVRADSPNCAQASDSDKRRLPLRDCHRAPSRGNRLTERLWRSAACHRGLSRCARNNSRPRIARPYICASARTTRR